MCGRNYQWFIINVLIMLSVLFLCFRVVEILQVTMDIILEKKIILSEILSAETAFILQHVQQNKLITDRDYSALKSLPQNTETMSGEVLDKLRDKG